MIDPAPGLNLRRKTKRAARGKSSHRLRFPAAEPAGEGSILISSRKRSARRLSTRRFWVRPWRIGCGSALHFRLACHFLYLYQRRRIKRRFSLDTLGGYGDICRSWIQRRRSGGTGRRAGLKIQWAQARVGSSPTFGTRIKWAPANAGALFFLGAITVSHIGAEDS